MPSEASLTTAIERFDLENWLYDHGGRETQAGEWALQCRDCGKDEKLIVSIARRAWHCWHCQEFVVLWVDGQLRRRPVKGAGGLLDLITMYDGGDRMAAANRVLADSRNSVEDLHHLGELRWVEPATGAGDGEAPAVPFPEFACAIQGTLPYLEQRSIAPADVERLGLFICTAGRYANRLVFPVWEGPRLVYYQARAMWDLRPGDVKALNPGRTEGAAVSTEVLLNLDHAAQYERVCIVEGPMDAVRVGPDAVCTFGKAISPTQESKLMAAGVTAVDLMWDADAIGDAWVAAAGLSENFEVRVVSLPAGDPADQAPGIPWTRAQLDGFRAEGTPITRGLL